MRLVLAISAISLGASFGAVSRWALTNWLTEISLRFNLIHWGTLIANLLGAFIAGFFIIILVQKTNLSAEWKLLILTGFCGALTTFSTFSLEIFEIMQQGRIGLAFLGIISHVVGSLLMTFFGFLLASYIAKFI